METNKCCICNRDLSLLKYKKIRYGKYFTEILCSECGNDVIEIHIKEAKIKKLSEEIENWKSGNVIKKNILTNGIQELNAWLKDLINKS